MFSSQKLTTAVGMARLPHMGELLNRFKDRRNVLDRSKRIVWRHGAPNVVWSPALLARHDNAGGTA
jgi:hypothetical protein